MSYLPLDVSMYSYIYIYITYSYASTMDYIRMSMWQYLYVYMCVCVSTHLVVSVYQTLLLTICPFKYMQSCMSPLLYLWNHVFFFTYGGAPIYWPTTLCIYLYCSKPYLVSSTSAMILYNFFTANAGGPTSPHRVDNTQVTRHGNIRKHIIWTRKHARSQAITSTHTYKLSNLVITGVLHRIKTWNVCLHE